jgi:hypothetical protein
LNSLQRSKTVTQLTHAAGVRERLAGETSSPSRGMKTARR